MTDEQFTPLAERYMDTVFRVAYSHLRCRGDADDVTEWVARDSYNYAAPNERIFVDVTGN